MRGSVDSQRGLPCLAGDMVSVNVCIVHDVNFHAGLFCGLNMGLDIVSGIDHQCRCPATAAERRMRDRLDPDAKLTHDHGLHPISRRTRDAPAGCTRRRVGSCCHCRRVRPNSIARRTSGCSCVKIGCQTASSNPTTTSSITAVTPGTPSLHSRGKSCRSGSAIGPASVDQCEDSYNSPVQVLPEP